MVADHLCHPLHLWNAGVHQPAAELLEFELGILSGLAILIDVLQAEAHSVGSAGLQIQLRESHLLDLLYLVEILEILQPKVP